jgi:hypothetical protein
LQGKNVLAYYENLLFTAVKSFITLTPGVFLALQAELLVEGVVFGNLDGVALRVEVLELDVATLEPLAEVSGLGRGYKTFFSSPLTVEKKSKSGRFAFSTLSETTMFVR